MSSQGGSPRGPAITARGRNPTTSLDVANVDGDTCSPSEVGKLVSHGLVDADLDHDLGQVQTETTKPVFGPSGERDEIAPYRAADPGRRSRILGPGSSGWIGSRHDPGEVTWSPPVLSRVLGPGSERGVWLPPDSMGVLRLGRLGPVHRFHDTLPELDVMS